LYDATSTRLSRTGTYLCGQQGSDSLEAAEGHARETCWGGFDEANVRQDPEWPFAQRPGVFVCMEMETEVARDPPR
jgi:hypothetical protein